MCNISEIAKKCNSRFFPIARKCTSRCYPITRKCNTSVSPLPGNVIASVSTLPGNAIASVSTLPGNAIASVSPLPGNVIVGVSTIPGYCLKQFDSNEMKTVDHQERFLCLYSPWLSNALIVLLKSNQNCRWSSFLKFPVPHSSVLRSISKCHIF